MTERQRVRAQRRADHAPPPRGPRLLGDRDADPRQVDARGRARLPGAGAPAARLVLRAAAVAAALQAADAARAASSATTRSPAASATRPSAPTASSSSRSSTSRCRSSTQDDVLELMEGLYAEIWREVLGVELELPLRRLTLRRGDAPLRLRPARPALRPGDRRRHRPGARLGVRRLPRRGRARRRRARAGVPRRRRPGRGASSTSWPRSPRSGAARGSRTCCWTSPARCARRSPSSSSAAELDGLREATGADAGRRDLPRRRRAAVVERVLGALRPHLAQRFELIPEGAWAFAWVVDFPAFQLRRGRAALGGRAPRRSRRRGRSTRRCWRPIPAPCCRRPTTSSSTGYEAGGGSIRINRPDLQQRALEVVGIDRRGRRGALRLPAAGAALRRPAARRHRDGPRPRGHAAEPAPTTFAT